MENNTFYKKTFNVEFNYEQPNSNFRFLSDTVWVGGFGWKVVLKKCQNENGLLYLTPYLISVKQSNEPWVCNASVEFLLESSYRDVKSIMATGKQEYSNSSLGQGWGIKKFCDWSKLLGFVKNGKLTLKVTITVDKNAVGGDPHPDSDAEIGEAYCYEDNRNTSCEPYSKRMRHDSQIISKDYMELYEEMKVEKEKVEQLLEEAIYEKELYQKKFENERAERLQLKEELAVILDKTQADIVEFRNHFLSSNN